MLLFWLVIGGLIGAWAAQRKGFSTLGGVLGGILLGPLAFLMFFVSGKVSSNEQQRKCPHCAEWIKPEAAVCKHCSRDIEPQQVPTVAKTSPVLVVLIIFLVGGVALVTIVGTLAGDAPSSSTRATSASASAPLSALTDVVTLSEYSGIQTGMSYSAVTRLIGEPGEEMSRNELAGIVTVMYGWSNWDGSNMNAMFQNDALVQKAQFGLD